MIDDFRMPGHGNADLPEGNSAIVGWNMTMTIWLETRFFQPRNCFVEQQGILETTAGKHYRPSVSRLQQ